MKHKLQKNKRVTGCLKQSICRTTPRNRSKI